jgi:uncharacterized protein
LHWARAQPTICAVALVGSHARGTARADSDIDLVALTTAPDLFRGDPDWIRAIEWNRCGASPANWQDEEYGQLWSRRIWLKPDRHELEIGFARPSWADVHPLDAGTRQVVADGCRILHDANGVLARLCAAVKSERDEPKRRRTRVSGADASAPPKEARY